MNRQIIPVILAGGIGERLWPLSRKSFPKQFLNLVSQHSLLQETVVRTQKVIDFSHMLIITNALHHCLCEEQLKYRSFNGPISYILEPCGRSTAPAIALAASYINEHIDKEALMLVLPADHLIKEEAKLAQSLKIATKPAQSGKLVIFGVAPTGPKTEYGYIQTGQELGDSIYQVNAFIEKPTLDTAQKYLSSKKYYWNSGMFLFQPTSYLREIELLSPEIYKHCMNTYTSSALDKNILSLNKETFSKCPSNSIDYAVMEKTSKAVMVPLHATWNDLGSWASIAEAQSSDANKNIIRGNGIEKYSTNCFVRSDDKLVSIIGLDNHIVISTQDAVLVANKDYIENIKELVNELDTTVTHDYQKTFFYWGYEELIETNDFSELTRIVIKPQSTFSLNLSDDFDRHWLVISGKGELLMNSKKFALLKSKQGINLNKSESYEAKNTGNTSLIIIETTML